MTSTLSPSLRSFTSSDAYSSPPVSGAATTSTTPQSSIRGRLTQAVGVLSIAATAALGFGALSFADNPAPAGPTVQTPAPHRSTELGRGNLPVLHLPTALTRALPADTPIPRPRG